MHIKQRYFIPLRSRSLYPNEIDGRDSKVPFTSNQMECLASSPPPPPVQKHYIYTQNLSINKTAFTKQKKTFSSAIVSTCRPTTASKVGNDI